MRRPYLCWGISRTELMVFLAAAGLFAAIAYPAYNDHQFRLHRAEAKVALMELAHVMANIYIKKGTYMPDGVEPKIGAVGEVIDYYHFSLDVDSENFTLTATPINTQENDPCGQLTVDHHGRKDIAGTLSNISTSQCW